MNPGVSGTLYFEYHDEPILLDINSGKHSFIPNADWEADLDFPLGIARYDSKPFPQSNKLLLTIENCLQGEHTLAPDYSCILVQDFAGNYQEPVITYKHDIYPGAEVAPDERHIAFVREYYDVDWLQIYTLNGEFVTNKQLSTQTLEWMPNGQLVYAMKRQLIFTKTYSLDEETVFSLPESTGEGFIDHISVSPDGKYLAFTLVYDGVLTISTYSNFWRLNIETQELHKIATIHENEVQTGFNSNTWSPDGKWIAVHQGGAGGFSSGSPGFWGQVYIMPVSDKTHVVSQYADKRSPGVIQLRRYRLNEYFQSDDSREASDIEEQFPNVEIHWLPQL
jgi:WD40 repeat protein